MKRTIFLLSLRLIVGLVFLLAGIAKLLLPPEEFINILRSYQVLPPELLVPVSFLLPGIELFCGSCLLVGIFLRWISLAIILQLIVFITIMAIVITSGIEIRGCGCFGNLGWQETPTEIILRDLILLSMSSILLFSKRHPYSLDNLFQDR